MEFFVNNINSILFLPLWAILMIFANAAVPFVASKRLTLNMTLASTLIGFVFAAGSLTYCIQNPGTLIESNFIWLNAGDIQISAGVLLDNLSALMAVIVTSVSFFIQLYSYGYMKSDKSFHRFFIYLNLFNFSMLGLVLSSNLIQTYVFWELVGLSSYLLIGFWFKKKSASDAAKKAFLVNRIGDVGLILGIIILSYYVLTFDVTSNVTLLGFSNMEYIAQTVLSFVSEPAFTGICFLLLMGSLAKSAQFPLHTWLADAMEGPTPVSALIHAATMVAAGVYLVARLYPLYSLSPTILAIITALGFITALICAFFAMSQNDIKKILAYSTSSQLGLMFTGLGVGAYSGALFHLTVHAYAKATLFLCAGIVIHAMRHEQDIKYFGGLRKDMPVCATAYLVSALSLAGLGFSGFFSKEMILGKILEEQNVLLAAGFILISFMTAFYLLRSYFLTFEGTKRFDTPVLSTRPSMLIPVVVLAVPSAFLGYILKDNFAQFICFISGTHGHIEVVAAVVSLTVAAFAVYMAFMLYTGSFNLFTLVKERALSKESLIYKLSYNKFYIDEINRWVIEKVLLRACRVLDFIEKYVIDGFVFVISLVTRAFSYLASKAQTGYFQTYAAYGAFSIAIILVIATVLYYWAIGG